MTAESTDTFENVKTRLDEIVEAVAAEDISLDDALGLYEEAVKLGMQASTLLEEGFDEQAVYTGKVEGEGSDFPNDTAPAVFAEDAAFVGEGEEPSEGLSADSDADFSAENAVSAADAESGAPDSFDSQGANAFDQQ